MLHHRFVKTTPKPSATKKSNGELDPRLGFWFGLLEPVADGTDDDVDVIFAFQQKSFQLRLFVMRRCTTDRCSLADAGFCGDSQICDLRSWYELLRVINS